MLRLSLQRQAVDTLETVNDVMNESWAPLLVRGLFLLPAVWSGPSSASCLWHPALRVLTWLSLCVALTGGGEEWEVRRRGRGREREVVFERLRYKGTLVGHLCLLILRCRAGITRQFRKRTSSVLICVFSAADQRGSLSPSLSLSNSAEHILVSGLPVSWKLGQKACHRYKTSKQGHPPNHFIKNTAELGDDLCL